MIKKRKTKIIKIIFPILLFLGALFIHFVFPRFITQKRGSMQGVMKKPKIDSVFFTQNEKATFKRKKLRITSFDNLKLTALLTYSNLDHAKATVILLHGTGANKSRFLGVSEFLANNGFNSVALDIRAFGESDGKFLTFGVKEKKDVKKLIDILIKNENLNNIGVWGHSVGGAIALQAMGIDNRIKFGITESIYTDLKSNFHDYFERHTTLNFTWLTNYLVNRAGKIGDFNPDDASPIKYSERITQPVLIVHGGKDVAMDVQFGKTVFAKIKSRDKQFVLLDSAGHSNIWTVGGDKYFNTVLEFIKKQSHSSDN